MKALLHAFIASRFPASARSLAVAVVYEDGTTHERATSVYEFLLRQLDEDARLTATWWRTSLVGDPKLSKAAARFIASADLIIVSVRDERSPSASVKEWIESWPIEEGRHIRLVAVLGDQAQDSPATEWDQYLREMAQQRKLIYLPGSFAAMTQSSAESNPDQETAERPDARVGEDRFIEPYVHWGLNE